MDDAGIGTGPAVAASNADKQDKLPKETQNPENKSTTSLSQPSNIAAPVTAAISHNIGTGIEVEDEFLVSQVKPSTAVHAVRSLTRTGYMARRSNRQRKPKELDIEKKSASSSGHVHVCLCQCLRRKSGRARIACDFVGITN